MAVDSGVVIIRHVCPMFLQGAIGVTVQPLTPDKHNTPASGVFSQANGT